MKFIGKIQQGKVLLQTPGLFTDFVKKSEGKPIELTVKVKRLTRSLKQNNYYWLLIGIIKEETGNDDQELHKYFRAKFLRETIIVFKKEELYVKSTTELDTKEFMEYCENIRVHMGEFGIELPLPDDGYLKSLMSRDY